MTHAELLCASIYYELVSDKKAVVLSEEAPFAAFELADRFGAKVFVRGRDKIPFEVPDKTRNGVFLAASIAPFFSKMSSVAEIRSLLPRFFTAEADLDASVDVNALLRKAVESKSFGECRTSNGIAAKYGGGNIRIVPAGGSLLRIKAECTDMEAASELASETVEVLRKLESL